MNNTTFRRRAKRNDRVAAWVITGGGIAVIAAVILILVLIVRVALPLFYSPAIEAMPRPSLPAPPGVQALAVGVDEYLESGFVILEDGSVGFAVLQDGSRQETIALERPHPDSRRITDAHSYGLHAFSLQWDNGATSLIRVVFALSYDVDGARQLGRKAETLHAFPPLSAPPLLSAARLRPDGGAVRASLTSEGAIEVEWIAVREDLFGNIETSTESVSLPNALPGPVAAMTLDSRGQMLYAGTDNGHLLRWDIRNPGSANLTDSIRAFSDNRAITALGFIFGDVSLAVGDARGGLSTWFPVRIYPGAEQRQLTQIRSLTSHPDAIVLLSPSLRNKSLLSVSAGGKIHLDHMTAERHLVGINAGGPVRYAALAPRFNGIVALMEDGRVQGWKLDSPHPDVSARVLFAKVHYENYDQPEFVWQSSAVADDFEPKKSLVPLIFGSFKGTFYAMLYALPLALFAAIYTSQFASGRVRGIVKPIVEVMAAIPSVVIGFLAALWLAPIVEGSVSAFLISVMVFPAILLAFVFLWQPFRQTNFAKRIERGHEFLILIPIILLGAFVAWKLGGMLDSAVFDGNFQQWLFSEAGMRYDQRNCIIIAFALGFAVIPIIFTIAEDALTSVPYSLKAASMALGATRWQTVWRVTLPSASPGIFAGTMIGFGRAVGETMIVLMATGNTPIMDWSPFNGMRTLSANIAVEIPEAPVNGTLYRVLFLSAVILFILTSLANTAAEVVRQRLRKKYGQF